MILQFLVKIKGRTDTSSVYLLLHSKLPGAVWVNFNNMVSDKNMCSCFPI